MLNYTPDEPSKLIANTSATLSVKNGIVSLLIVASVLVGLRLQMQVTNHDTRMSFAFGLKKFVDTGITVAIIAKSAVKAEGNMGRFSFLTAFITSGIMEQLKVNSNCSSIIFSCSCTFP